ncbi:histidine kinase [Ligilactobacillus agilis]|uniref:Histidine kinase n=4 Tax=Ligilactobacillus agilis TaxID=1601 RepID=A0A6F9Y7R9_9LACO|nr:histidine kinase [Ligilactobacillus agilis]
MFLAWTTLLSFIFLCCCNVFFEFYTLSKLLNKRSTLLIFWGTLGVINNLLSSYYNSLIFVITELSLLYLVFKQKKRDYQTMGVIMVISLLSYIPTAVLTIFTTFVEKKHLFDYEIQVILPAILVVTTAYIIFYKFLMKHDIKKFFYPPDGLVNLFLVTYTYGVIISFDYIHFVSYKSAVFIIPIVYLIQLLFAFFISMVSHRIRKASVDKKTTETLLFYTKQLEESQRSLRQFKHDYQNILISMEAELKDNDNFKELLAYSASHLEKSKAWRFNDLDNVSDPEIKSIVISKLDNCFTNSLPVSFECRQPLREIQGINKFDLIRLLGIAFDNAIEASENFTAPEIKVLLLNTDVGFEFEIRNKVAGTFDTTKLQQAGVTTKEGHAGLGLASAQAIISNYNNVFLAHAIKDNWFTFTLSVNKEG